MATSTVSILIKATDQASAVFSKVGASAAGLEKSLGNIGKVSGQGLGALATNLGRMQGVSSAASVGINSLQHSLKNLEGTGNDAVATIANLASAVLVFGPLGAMVAFAFDRWNDAAGNAAETMKQAQEEAQQLRSFLAGVDASPIERIAASAGLSVTALRDLARSSAEVRTELEGLAAAQEKFAAASAKIAIVSGALKDTYDLLNQIGEQKGVGLEGFIETLKSAPQFFTGLFTAIQQGVGITGDFAKVLNTLEEAQIKAEHAASVHAIALNAEAAALAEVALAADYAAAAANRFAAAMGDTRAEAIKGRREDARSLSQMRTDAFFTKMEFKEGVGWVERMTPALKSAQSAAEKLWNTLKGLVQGAIAPTSVTDADVAATAAGKYIDKWDELRRQAEAVDTGTPIEQFEKLKAALEETGLSAGEFAAQFKSMSLFADPVNIKFADLGAIVANVKDQLKGMLGQSNLMEAAMKEVWASLTPEDKAALAKSGIADMGDAILELTEPAMAAKGKVLELAGAVRGVPTAVTTTFTIQQASNWDEVLEDILADIAKIPTDIGIYVHTVNGIPDPNGGAVPDGYGTYGGGQPDLTPPPIGPPGQGPSIAGATNNSYGNNKYTFNLSGVQNGSQLYREFTRKLGRRANLRAAQGL